jgi:hypothetical protein
MKLLHLNENDSVDVSCKTESLSCAAYCIRSKNPVLIIFKGYLLG